MMRDTKAAVQFVAHMCELARGGYIDVLGAQPPTQPAAAKAQSGIPVISLEEVPCALRGMRTPRSRG
jgi:hypothetical protein